MARAAGGRRGPSPAVALGVAWVDDPVELLTYAADAGLQTGRPDAVAFPTTEEDVARLIRWARERGVPVVARGAGTGTSGGAVAERGGLILAFGRMARIVDLDEAGQAAVVEPGAVNAELDRLARSRGLFYPPDPASGTTCTLGGNIAENAGGPRCFKYGVTANYVLGLRAVLADGRVLSFGGAALDAPEYDWTGVLTGSEGTLAVVTQARLRLLRRPAGSALLLAAFDTVEAAGEAVSAMIAQGLTPATIEMMDQTIVAMIETYAPCGLPVDAGAVLIVEVDGATAGLAAQLAEIRQALAAGGARDVIEALTEAERERIWNARKGSAGALVRLAPAYYPSDCTVPRSQIARALREITAICASAGLRVCYLLHAGDGNLHPNILIDRPEDPALMQRVLAAEARALEVCLALGGSITGEHGVGSERRDFMLLMYGPAELGAMHDVKAVFDPEGLLNPGKIFPESIAQPGAGPGVYPAGETVSHGSGVALGETLRPASAEEAAQVVRACRGPTPALGIRVLGSGSKAGALAGASVTLSTAGLAGVRAYAPADLYVTAGAGSSLDAVQAELARDRAWVPLVSPWPGATLGGIISANCNAPLRMRSGYGGIRDLLLAAEAVLPDGRIIRVGRPVVKNVAGYDLPKLFVGAYGTLGLLTAVTLRIAPWPATRSTVIFSFDDLAGALAAGAALRRVCVSASALLLGRRVAFGVAEAPYALAYTVEGSAGDTAAELAEALAAVRQTGAGGDPQEAAVSATDSWAAFVREASEGGLVVRAGVPSGEMAGVVAGLDRALSEEPYLVDLGNSLIYIGAQPGSGQLPVIRRAAVAAGGYAMVLAGWRARTHPGWPAGRPAVAPDNPGVVGDDPPAAVDDDRWGYAPESLELMQRLKARWDPAGCFNPGAFLV